ncbi:MAG: FCD domain-containing protein [Propionibacteriaceae bacterium]|nr:FCD domain-containing protein [Propionibacteriaceae bacterium]
MAATLHESVLDQWGEGIVSGKYLPGDRISLDDEVTGQKASRTVGREAMRVLESMGMVTVKRKSGAVVNPPARWHSFDPQLISWRLDSDDRAAQLHALSELRLAVEPVAARLAALNASAQQWADLTEAAITMAANSDQADQPAYLDADMRFHATLLAASGNYMFESLSGVVKAVLQGRTRHGLMPSHANPEAVQLHVDIAAAVGAKDADRAEAAMREIVEEADHAVQQA